MSKKKMKRILIIGLTERMGGVETFIYNTTIHSNKEKYKYDFLVHGSVHCVFENEINHFYNDGEQHIYFIRKYKDSPLGCIRDLMNFYSKNGDKYDYIHFQSGSTAEILYVYPFCKKYKISVISHSHNGNGYSPVVNSIFKVLVNKVSTKRVSCSNEATKWLFGRKYLKNTQIVFNGIDTTRFTYSVDARRRIRNQYQLTDEFIIGHVGRFSEQKNHKFIIEVFRRVLEKEPTAKLMLVGTGELQNSIKELINNYKIKESVIFAGQQMRTEDYYSAFDVFLMPSLYEGLPIVGIEAQCEGLQCFFSNSIDKQILLTDRSYMLDLKDTPESWAERVLLRNQTERQNYSRIIEMSGFSLSQTIKTLETIYDIDC